jgi:hypothetical protein
VKPTPSERQQFEQSYLNTIYRVRAPEGTIAIRIGEPCPALERVLEEVGAATWAFITACNPYSQTLTAEVNAQRQAQLEQMLAEAGLAMIPGEGVGIDGDWPLEASVLVLGLKREQAIAIAQVWEQNAIVYGERGGLPELVWCVA